MKPGSRDKRYQIRISGAELKALKSLADAMAEAFGLDRRVMAYQGKRSLGLYRWDLDCLVDVVGLELGQISGGPTVRSNKKERLKPITDLFWLIRSSGLKRGVFNRPQAALR